MIVTRSAGFLNRELYISTGIILSQGSAIGLCFLYNIRHTRLILYDRDRESITWSRQACSI